MNVRLIAVSAPQVDGIKNGDELISFCARVSNPSNQLNVETAPRLINFCIKNGHWSIFEQADMTVEIKTSRAIAAQILRHKSFNFQEFSQRYAQATELEVPEWRLQGKTNRQVGDEPVDLSPELQEMVDVAQSASMAAYNALIEKGIAKECARMILPLNTQTTLYMKGSARSWITYFNVRCDQHTQKEHRDIAIAIRKIFSQEFPNVAKALGYDTSTEDKS
jgi:thymidylate synthase (FAD)